jgi:hypothetical protein
VDEILRAMAKDFDGLYKLRALAKVAWQFIMTATVFNLWRLPKLQTAEV